MAKLRLLHHAHSLYHDVMVNFTGQLDWATGYSDGLSNTLLGVSVRVLLDEFSI